MRLHENKQYIEDLLYIANIELPWDKLKNKSVLISGSSGLIGSCLVDVLMLKNNTSQLNCTIYALGRSEQKARERFDSFWENSNFKFVPGDINVPLAQEDMEAVDYVIHLASNTHPVLYSTDPIGTITTNIVGTNNMLQFAVDHKAKRMLFASSNEIYGENRGDTEMFDEAYCGYINSNTLRAGYPESKRCGEALCQAYIRQKGLDIVIPRFTRSYGPTMLLSDSKAISQFIRKGVTGEDIVLKSEGKQYYSYTYVADAVTGLLTVLLRGDCGEAYNIADEASDIMLKDLAMIVAETVGRRVVYDLPDEIELAGYSTATKARLDSGKLQVLGWKAKYNIRTGLVRTVNILKEVNP